MDSQEEPSEAPVRDQVLAVRARLLQEAREVQEAQKKAQEKKPRKLSDFKFVW